MFFPKYFGNLCTFDETLAVSGAGTFYFDYMDPFLYVTDQGTSNNSVFKIYDMSDPAGPVLKSTTSLPNGSGAVHPRAHQLSGYGRVCLIPYRTSKVLAIWDVNDTTSPTLLGSLSVPFAPNTAAAIGTKACVGYNENFLQTRSADRIDISNPASPSIDANWSSSRLVLEIRTSSDHFFLCGQNNSGGAAHLTAIRASDFAVRDTATDGVVSGTGAGALKLNAAATLAFSINCSGAIIDSWDIADPTNITLTQGANILGGTPSTACIAVAESLSRAYVGRGGGSNLEIDIINISNPASMTLAGDIDTSSETVTDIQIMDDGCAGLAWAQGTGAAIHLLGTPPTS